jgi:hypothetical protein
MVTNTERIEDPGRRMLVESAQDASRGTTIAVEADNPQNINEFPSGSS